MCNWFLFSTEKFTVINEQAFCILWELCGMSKGNTRNSQKTPRTLDFLEHLTLLLRNKWDLLIEQQGKLTKKNFGQKKKPKRRNIWPYLSFPSLSFLKYILVIHNPQFSKKKEHHSPAETFAWIHNRLYQGGNGNYQSCFRTACPFKVSTLKLLVFAGMMKNTITVTSVLWTCMTRKEEEIKTKSKSHCRVSQPTFRINHRKHRIHFGFPGRLWSHSSCYKWSLVKSEIKTEMPSSFSLGNQIFPRSHGLENMALDVHINCKKIKILHTFSPETNDVGSKEWVIGLLAEVCLGMRWEIPYSSGEREQPFSTWNPGKEPARHTKTNE